MHDRSGVMVNQPGRQSRFTLEPRDVGRIARELRVHQLDDGVTAQRSLLCEIDFAATAFTDLPDDLKLIADASAGPQPGHLVTLSQRTRKEIWKRLSRFTRGTGIPEA